MKTWYYLPRILSILLIIFVSLFALDVFSERQWYLALLIHLIPTFGLIIITSVAWKNDLLGGIIFAASGIILIAATHLEAYIIALPLIVIGGLYILSNFLKNKKGA